MSASDVLCGMRVRKCVRALEIFVGGWKFYHYFKHLIHLRVSRNDWQPTALTPTLKWTVKIRWGKKKKNHKDFYKVPSQYKDHLHNQYCLKRIIDKRWLRSPGVCGQEVCVFVRSHQKHQRYNSHKHLTSNVKTKRIDNVVHLWKELQPEYSLMSKTTMRKLSSRLAK